MKSLLLIISEWDARHDSFAKLQHAYIGLAIVSLLGAGIIGLVNYSLGQSILFFAIVAALVFVGNGVIWALLRTFILPKSPKSTSSRKK